MPDDCGCRYSMGAGGLADPIKQVNRVRPMKVGMASKPRVAENFVGIEIQGRI